MGAGTGQGAEGALTGAAGLGVPAKTALFARGA
jgi:hypothetical protein